MAAEIPFKLIFFVLIALAVLLEAVADVLFKKWSLGSRNLLLIIGFVIYFIGTVFWAFSLKYEYLSKAISVFTVINLIVIVLIGFLYFNEDLSLTNKIGVMLGVISVILVEL